MDHEKERKEVYINKQPHVYQKQERRRKMLKRHKKVMSLFAISSVTLGIWFSGAQAGEHKDFGIKMEHVLNERSEQLFGIERPLLESAHGPYTYTDNAGSIAVARGLKVSVVSNVTNLQADMIAFWPDDINPTHLFVCVEDFFSDNSAPDRVSVQRVNLYGDPDNNVETIVKGISSCDPLRRTPPGGLVVGGEAGIDGGFYEIMDPMGISGSFPLIISDRSAGMSNDPLHVAKRKAVGNVSWEGNVILEDGTIYFGDENRPSNGKAGGGIYKFIPSNPYQPWMGMITEPNLSPFASGANYGMRLGTRSDNTDYGQGSETGKGIWISVDGSSYMDADGNIKLRNAQTALGLTGYYRPEDMEIDPIAIQDGLTRLCWTMTGRMTNGLNSEIENGHNYGEVLCLTDESQAGAVTGRSPVGTRFLSGDRDANHFDNQAFQPETGNMVLLEDGAVEVLNADGTLKELRGNDIWMCLPDGADRNVQSDGCIRIVSLKDTDAEPTGFIFDASGKNAYVNIMHRATGQGALLKISGFKIKKHD